MMNFSQLTLILILNEKYLNEIIDSIYNLTTNFFMNLHGNNDFNLIKTPLWFKLKNNTFLLN